MNQRHLRNSIHIRGSISYEEIISNLDMNRFFLWNLGTEVELEE